MPRSVKNSTMSSATSTERETPDDAGFRPSHLFILLSMVAATVAVMLSRQTQPAALLLLSAAIIAAGLIGFAIYHAAAGFFSQQGPPRVLDDRERDVLEREKSLVLRSIKELEFDRSMKKIGDADFADMNARLRARALSLMEQLERGKREELRPAKAARARATGPYCDQCGTENDPDAKFCKQCGRKLK